MKKYRVKTNVLIILLYLLMIPFIKIIIIDSCKNIYLVFGICWLIAGILKKIINRIEE